jgi:hypothetical protein
MVTLYLKNGTTVTLADATRVEHTVVGELPNFNGVVGLNCYDGAGQVIGRFVLAEIAGYTGDLESHAV